MAESLPFGRSIDKGSDNILDYYCEPCHELKDEIKPVAGHCIDCDESLCVECFDYHLGPKPFRNHKLVNTSAKPQIQPKPLKRSHNTDEMCHLHQGAIIKSFCKYHSQLCCNVCKTITHKTCDVQAISEIAKDTKDSPDFLRLNKKLKNIQKGFEEHLDKTGHNELKIQKIFTNAINDMRKLRNEIDKLSYETEKMAEKIKEENLKKIEIVSSTCNILIEQINNISSNLDMLKMQDEGLFIAMKRAEDQLQSLENSVYSLHKDNTVREYTFEPYEKLRVIMKDLNVLGHLAFTDQIKIRKETPNHVATVKPQISKSPIHMKDIQTNTVSEKKVGIFSSLALPNNKVLITDNLNQKLKQFDSIQCILSLQLQLRGCPYDIAKIESNKVAAAVNSPNHIQLVSLSQHSLEMDKAIPVNGNCRGIAYNTIAQTFIVTIMVTYNHQCYVEIINMKGTVLKTLDNDSTGKRLFSRSNHLALSPDKKSMYVSDGGDYSVKLLTLDGDLKALYKDSRLQDTAGLFVHKSGLVYVVGKSSHIVHQIEPDSGDIKLLLEHKDGLKSPWSISYCEVEDKLYVGMEENTTRNQQSRWMLP